MVLFAEFQSEGTDQEVPEVRKICVAACAGVAETKKNKPNTVSANGIFFSLECVFSYVMTAN